MIISLFCWSWFLFCACIVCNIFPDLLKYYYLNEVELHFTQLCNIVKCTQIICLYKGQRHQLYYCTLCLYHTIGSLNPKSRKRKQRGNFCHLNQTWRTVIAFAVCNPLSSWWTANASVWTANSSPARPAAAITRKSMAGCVTHVAWPGLKRSKTFLNTYFTTNTLR